MCQIYIVVMLIRMYSVYTASVLRPVLYKHNPVLCTCVLLSFLPSSPWWSVPRGEAFNPPTPLFLFVPSNSPEFGPLSLGQVSSEIFLPLLRHAHTVPIVYIYSFLRRGCWVREILYVSVFFQTWLPLLRSLPRTPACGSARGSGGWSSTPLTQPSSLPSTPPWRPCCYLCRRGQRTPSYPLLPFPRPTPHSLSSTPSRRIAVASSPPAPACSPG